MDIEHFRNYCIQKKGVTEEFPFDDATLVFKVMGKMFALASLDAEQLSISLKCEPEKAVELRERYESIQPGYHMNKKHWNTIVVENIKPQKLIFEWIDDSYNLVVASLPKKTQNELKSLS
jgi:predicted DNA-binding protein (MmcQ/YjbR family)